MGSNANLWVLDFLLEADGLDDTLIKHFHDVNSSQFEELPPNTQARLMLRVLRDAPGQPTGVAEAALGALNMLKTLADQVQNWGQHFVPGANLEALKPSPQLFTEVKTELVLKSMREGNQGEHPKVILDTFFSPPEQGGSLDAFEQDRRNEILEGLKGPEEAQQLLAKFPPEQLNHTLLAFVAEARAALGPNMLKLVEKDVIEQRYDPYQQFQPPPAQPPQSGQEGKTKGGRAAAAKRKRSTKGATTTEEEHAAGMLANMSQSNAVLEAAGGVDPLADVVQAAQATAAKPAGQDGLEIVEGVAPQQTPDGQPLSPLSLQTAGTTSGKTPGQPPRRKNGRWSEAETEFLVRMVREKGKGKWKRILEDGGTIFQNRSQVDLKDKWRNLERQGVVGPGDLPPQAMAHQLPGGMSIMQLNMPTPFPQAQFGPDGQLISLLGPDGNPLTQDQAQHYAQLAAQYAQFATVATGHSLPHEALMHPQMGGPAQLQQQQMNHQQQMQQQVVQDGQGDPGAAHHHMEGPSHMGMQQEQEQGMQPEQHMAPVIKGEDEGGLTGHALPDEQPGLQQ